MDVALPTRLLTGSLDGRVLAVLARTTGSLTGRKVSELVGDASYQGVLDALRRLQGQGLVHGEEAGRSTLYTLNREHVAAPIAEALRDMRSIFIERIKQEIKEWKITPVHASLFGSFARRDGDQHSDIDVFIVRPDSVDEEDEQWERQIEILGDHIEAWSGNRAGISEVSEKDVLRLRRERPPVVENLITDGIVLYGPKSRSYLKRIK